MRRASAWNDASEMGQPDASPTALFATSTVIARAVAFPLMTNVEHRARAARLSSAGLPHQPLYDTRHTAATRMLAMGIEIPVVADILGHERASFTMDAYVHALADQRRAAASKLGAFMGAIATP